ncbi:MAG TPA: tetratricopeptide repeat protein [Candidatus Saccharimonadales bacterium]|nr:tetratricopeptide repeat protein [Candidatus Saccharimonadales bacterium]
MRIRSLLIGTVLWAAAAATAAGPARAQNPTPFPPGSGSGAAPPNEIFRAEALLMVRQYPSAYLLFHQLHQKYPEDSRVTEGLVRVLEPLDHWVELEQVITEERARRKSVMIFGREMVAACRGQGHYEQALEEDLQAWVTTPGEVRLRALADTLLLENNYSPRALDVLKRMTRMAPRHAPLRQLLVESLARAGRGEEACREALAYDRETAGAGRTLLGLARAAANDHPAETVRAAEMLIHEFPNTPQALEARVLRAGALRGTPRWEEARRDLEELARDRSAGAAAVSAAVLLAEAELARDPEAARGRARQLAAEHPEAREQALWVEGESYQRQRRFQEAATTFAQAAASLRDPEAVKRALWSRAESFFYEGAWDSATAAYKTVAAAFLRDARADGALARMLLIADATEESDSALRAYAKASFEASLAPARADSLFEAIQERFPKALASFEALYQRAEIRRHGGDLTGALRLYLVFADTTLRSPRAQDALFLAAEICRTELKDARRALDLYSDVATRFPDSWLAPDARKWVEVLRREVGS